MENSQIQCISFLIHEKYKLIKIISLKSLNAHEHDMHEKIKSNLKPNRQSRGKGKESDQDSMKGGNPKSLDDTSNSMVRR